PNQFVVTLGWRPERPWRSQTKASQTTSAKDAFGVLQIQSIILANSEDTNGVPASSPRLRNPQKQPWVKGT
ncbi:MAG TPA: hypothetical protein VEC99_18060, partial [Clostridia bacterium]|nr:hypothetical protein [Clostridia bacterium]